MTEKDMHTRESDHANGTQQFVTIDRKIPITWLVGGAVTAAVVAGGMYYQLQRTTEKTSDISIEVKAIRDDIAKQGRKSIDDDYAARDLQRRVTVIEATLQAERETRKGSK